MRLGIAAVLLAGVFAAAGSAFMPSDPDGSHPAYATLNLPAAWEMTTGSPNVVVAVVDSGIDPSHADLAGAVLPGYDFVDRDTDPSDPLGGGHGTAVSGVAAARANNGVGGVGACFDCRLMPLRVLGRDNIALNTNTAAAIDYAVDHGAAVVNASIYGEHSPTQLHDAVARARAGGSSWSQRPGTRGTRRPSTPLRFPRRSR